MDLILIRHARPAVAEGICYGRSDLDTVEAAADVAAALKTRLPPAFRLYASPLRRCAALAAALGPAPQLDARLMEIDFGRWEMRPWLELGAATLERWQAEGFGAGLHGGEAYADFRARVLDWLRERVEEGTGGAPSGGGPSGGGPSPLPRVAVTHAGVIRVLIAELTGMSLERSLSHPVPYAGIVRLRADGNGEWRMET